MLPGPCTCGSHWPAIRVEGRHDDVLRMTDRYGRRVDLLPLVPVAVLDQNHWEFNVLASARWERFRWNDRIHRSTAYGVFGGSATAPSPPQHARSPARCNAAGLQPGQTVAIMLPTSPAYLHSYLGILMAGGIPVPSYPPARASQLEDHVLRHAGILANAQAALLITVPAAMVVARLLQARVPGRRHQVDELAKRDAVRHFATGL